MFKSEGEMKSFESKREKHKENEDQGPLRNITGRIRETSNTVPCNLILSYYLSVFSKSVFYFHNKRPNNTTKTTN